MMILIVKISDTEGCKTEDNELGCVWNNALNIATIEEQFMKCT